MCDDPVTECVYKTNPPKCEVRGCDLDCTRYFSVRVDESTLNASCPDSTVVYAPEGRCVGCGDGMCEAPTGYWECDVKKAPKCVPQCEHPGNCGGKIVYSYLPTGKDYPDPFYLAAYIVGSIAVVTSVAVGIYVYWH